MIGSLSAMNDLEQLGQSLGSHRVNTSNLHINDDPYQPEFSAYHPLLSNNHTTRAVRGISI